jgi:hypothetical protein
MAKLASATPTNSEVQAEYITAPSIALISDTAGSLGLELRTLKSWRSVVQHHLAFILTLQVRWGWSCVLSSPGGVYYSTI